ncbi:hypothetical protein LINGRAHAP2_LOCUS5580 [Linum grandiflorum]
MCTTISSGGGGSGSGGAGKSHQSVVNCMTFSKKNNKKKQKVPKRGPGVAELEKLLRQEDRQPIPTTAAAAVAFPPPSPATLFSIPSPQRSQLYSFVPQPTTSFPRESSSSISSRSGLQFPLSNHVNGASSLDHQMQRFQQQPSSPTMMNFFPRSSSSEPPSNQNRHFPEKTTMIGGKRQYPFYIDNTVAATETPPFRFQPPSYLPSFFSQSGHDTDSRGNLVLLGCPTTREQHSMFYNHHPHPPPMQQRSVECHYEGQMMMNKQQPLFYSFLEEPAIVSKELMSDQEEADGVDLRLKL